MGYDKNMLLAEADKMEHKALEMVAGESTMDDLGDIYRLLEVSEKIKEIAGKMHIATIV